MSRRPVCTHRVLALAALCASGTVACGLDWQRYRPRDATVDGDADASCPNAIRDPSFEQEPPGFGGRWITYQSTVTREMVPDARTGRHVARVAIGEPPGAPADVWMVFASTPPTPPTTRRVEASAWVRLAPGSPTLPNMFIKLHERRVPDGGGSLEGCQPTGWTVTPLGRALSSSAEWTRIEGVFEMPVTSAGCRIDVQVGHEGDVAGGAFEIDDVSACFVQ